MGRARPQSPRHPPARGNRRPGRRGPRARAAISTANLVDATPTILALLGLADPGPRRRQTDRRARRRRLMSAPAASMTRQDPAEEPFDGPHPRPFEYTSEEQQIIEQRLADLGYLE